MNALFITGTDTDAGKTWVSCALLQTLNQLGKNTLALKPLATGCNINDLDQDSDIAHLAKAASHTLPITDMVFAHCTTPCSPNIGIPTLQASSITAFCQQHIITHKNECTLIEGIGGWLCPINDTETMADAILPLKCPIVLIVGIKLGCLNHVLLTVKQMLQQKAPIIGWIANCLDPDMIKQQENIAYLERALPIPCLAQIPFGTSESATKALKPFAKTLAEQ